MPDFATHIRRPDQARPRHSGGAANLGAANPTPTIADLVRRNAALLAQNRQLTAALARLGAKAGTAVEGLTPRQRQVMALVLNGLPSKIIAADLTISRRTVKSHRAEIMPRTGATSLPALTRLSLGLG